LIGLASVRAAQAKLEGSELQRINGFLELLSTKTDITFIRNGSSYPVEKAVSHLKSKLKQARNKISSGEEFVEHVASKSSISGKPYEIILPNGNKLLARDYFYELLKEVDSKN
jgi:hypothetical protein